MYFMNLILPPKFEGDFHLHLKDPSIFSVVKRGGSCITKPQDALDIVLLPETHNARVVVPSAPSGVSQQISNLFTDHSSLKTFSRKIEMGLAEIKLPYQNIFKPLGVEVFREWSDTVSLFREVVSETDFEDPEDRRKLESFAFGQFGEIFTAKMLHQLAIQQGKEISILPTHETIFLQENFPGLPEDKFASVPINLEKSFEALAIVFPKSGAVLAPGFVAKNGLLGWNGSDTTASILVLFLYVHTGVVPRVIFQKDRPFETVGGKNKVILEGATKYSYFKNRQKRYEQPYIHPQAIDLLDEPCSIPFKVEVPGDSYELLVTSCSKLADFLGAHENPAGVKVSSGE